MAKKTAEKTPRPKKPKQGFLPDMEPPSIKAIDDAADDLHDVRSRRISLSSEEEQLATNLLALMHEHKLTVYEYDGKRVEIAALEKIKVKKNKSADE